MWPMYVDYTDDECKRILRSLELEAYASVVNAFRAQGPLNKDRKKMLQELCSALSISLERHRAEIRRAVNDEHLNTIAERLSGPNTSTEWAIEGRRLVPLMPRLVPQTVFTVIANSAATAQAAKNATLPLPGKTGLRESNENDGIDTMASRKRKDHPPDGVTPPQKFVAVDNQYSSNNLCPLESVNAFLPESIQPLSDSSAPDSFVMPVSATQGLSSLVEHNPVKNLTSGVACITSTAPVKSISKHIMVKPTSTVTTFSSFDQLASNIISSRSVPPSPVPVVAHEEQVSTSDVKSLNDNQNSITSLSPCAIKGPSVTPVHSSNTSSISVEHFPITSSSVPSSGSKFLTQIRPKAPTHTRQTPTSLGVKMNSQPQIGQRAQSPKSANLKVKPDSMGPLSSFTKKQLSSVHTPSSSSDSQVPQFPLLSSSESLHVPKSPLPIVAKSNITKSECSNVTNQPVSQHSSTKMTTLPKNFHKPATHGSQFVARTLFSSAAKTGAKSLPPVIFNVSTTSCSPLQSSTKTTIPVQSEAGKISTPQLLPKSTSGISHNQFKLSTSNAQTIQYRNEGGMMRSARIVNISQPVGSRLPCAISPSAISALGLSSNLTSTALRVTLPAGTLNTPSAIRVSAAAKPNVIVVHKAQMWPRTQGAAVIMSSSAPLPRLTNDGVKQEKNRQSGSKIPPRSIVPVRPQSPAIPSTSVKVTEVSSSLAADSSKVLQADNPAQPDSTSSRISDNNSEAKCKRNLLADIIEASGIIFDRGSPEKSSRKAPAKTALPVSSSQVEKSVIEGAHDEVLHVEPIEVQIRESSDVIVSQAQEVTCESSPMAGVSKAEKNQTTEVTSKPSL